MAAQATAATADGACGGAFTATTGRDVAAEARGAEAGGGWACGGAAAVVSTVLRLPLARWVPPTFALDIGLGCRGVAALLTVACERERLDEQHPEFRR
jgi:hypothetical protein